VGGILAICPFIEVNGQEGICKTHLSSVAHLVRDEGVAGSNPATPTKLP
jgi:hypothetical protein